MREYLDAVQEQLETGAVTGQALVLLFRAAEEAEHRNDVEELELTVLLARRVAGRADEPLAVEAERLIELCEERLERTRAARDTFSSPARDVARCPGCGRPVDASAVRCRACGTLLV